MRRRTRLNPIWRAFHLFLFLFFVCVCVCVKEIFTERARQRLQIISDAWLVVGLQYLHDVFAVGTTIAPKVDGRLYDGAEQTGP
jgi:hypothetical protein